METICMECQNLFSGKNKKKYINMPSAENFTQTVKPYILLHVVNTLLK